MDQPEENAVAVLFPASEHSRAILGVEIVVAVDGRNSEPWCQTISSSSDQRVCK